MKEIEEVGKKEEERKKRCSKQKKKQKEKRYRFSCSDPITDRRRLISNAFTILTYC